MWKFKIFRSTDFILIKRDLTMFLKYNLKLERIQCDIFSLMTQ